jgi:hypothetical protein
MLELILEYCLELVGPLLVIAKTLRRFQDLKYNLFMGHVVLNLILAYARLAWPTHPSMTN